MLRVVALLDLALQSPTFEGRRSHGPRAGFLRAAADIRVARSKPNGGSDKRSTRRAAARGHDATGRTTDRLQSPALPRAAGRLSGCARSAPPQQPRQLRGGATGLATCRARSVQA